MTELMSDLAIWGNVARLRGGVFLSGNWTVKFLNLKFPEITFEKLPSALSVGLYGINQKEVEATARF